jgi:long-chain fatty acid transport protein
VSNVYRTARVPDQDRTWLAIGASYRVLPSVTVDGGYAHAFVLDSRIRETSPTGDVLTGRYSNMVDIFSIGTRTQF